MIRKVILTVILAASVGYIVTPAIAATYTQVAPPALRSEAIPAPRHGRVWVAGHWGWRNQRHQWVKGTWIRERRGYQYNQPAWIEREGRWQMQAGNWRRQDQDGDGVPNRQDRAPNNPHRN